MIHQDLKFYKSDQSRNNQTGFYHIYLIVYVMLDSSTSRTCSMFRDILWMLNLCTNNTNFTEIELIRTQVCSAKNEIVHNMSILVGISTLHKISLNMRKNTQVRVVQLSEQSENLSSVNHTNQFS